MASKISMGALFAVVAALVFQSTYAATYTVGDSTGWRVPPNTDFFENWADNKNFAVNDILVFNFATGQHDVAQVTEAAYDGCSTANAISVENTGPARITLNRTGDHYFICNFAGHCSGGQKLKVEVRTGSSAPTPGSSPTTPTGTALTPGSSPNTPSGTVLPPSSASSLVATLSLVLMSIALVLFC